MKGESAYTTEKGSFAVLLIYCIILTAEAAGSSNHHVSADITNKLTDNANCPGWTDVLKWEIATGFDCSTASSFTTLNCLNDQNTKINSGETIRAECQISDLPSGNLEKYCLRVTWCSKGPTVGGTSPPNPEVRCIETVGSCGAKDCPILPDKKDCLPDQTCERCDDQLFRCRFSTGCCSGKCGEQNCGLSACGSAQRCSSNEDEQKCSCVTDAFCCSGTCGESNCGGKACSSGERCSPGADGTQCVCVPDTSCGAPPTYRILFIQVNISGLPFKPIADFSSRARQAEDNWVKATALGKGTCRNKVAAIVAEDKICDVSGDVLQMMAQVRSCAADWGYTDYTRLVGVVQHTPSRAELPGNTVLVVDTELELDTAHELGHTYGLCDEGYGIQKDSSCQPSGYCGCAIMMCACGTDCRCCPNKPEPDNMMCTEDACNMHCTYDPTKFDKLSSDFLDNILAPFCK